MNRIRRYLLKLKAFLWTAFALCTIVLALVIGISSLFLPLADRYRPEFQTWLSEQMGQPIEFNHLRAEWTSSGPKVFMQGVRIGDPSQQPMELDLATFSYNVYNWFRSNSGGAMSFEIIAEELSLIHDEQGQIRVQGLSGSDSGEDNLDAAWAWLQSQSLIRLSAQQVHWIDLQADKHLDINQLHLALSNQGSKLMLSGDAVLDNSSDNLEFTLEYDLQQAKYRWFAETGNTELPALTGWLSPKLLVALQGQAEFEIWGEYDRETGLLIDGDLSLEDAIFAGELVQPEGRLDTRFSLEQFDTGLHFEWRDSALWAIALKEMNISRSGRETSIAELELIRNSHDSEKQWVLQADRFELSDLTDALNVVNIVPDELRARFYHLAPAASLNQIAFSAGPQGISGSLEFQDFSVANHSAIPAVSGIDGSVDFTNGQGQFTLSGDEAIIDLPLVFREPFLFEALQTRGGFQINPDKTWQIEANDLTFKNQGIQAAARLTLAGDESPRPFIDAKVKITAPADARLANRFWPYQQFSPDLLRWLDNAILEGEVTSGEALIYGDLDNWPFRNNEGRFLAQAHISNGTLNYRPEWPELTKLEADLMFTGIGLSGTATSAEIANIKVEQIDAALSRYKEPVVILSAKGGGENEDLLNLLNNSPIHDTYGEYLDHLQATGQGQVDLNLAVPLVKRLGEPKVDGVVTLSDSMIVDTQWDITLEQTQGNVVFSEQGFEALALETEFNGYAANLDIASGNFVEDGQSLATATLSSFSPGTALQPQIPDLEPVLSRISGSCAWQIDVAVPTTPGMPTRLELSADLTAANMDFPAPLNKLPGAIVPVKVSTDLAEPLARLNVQVGDDLHFIAKRVGENQEWGAKVHFGSQPPEDPDHSGIAVSGNVEELDADGWIDYFNQLASAAGTPPEQRWIDIVDLQIGDLTLLGRGFQLLTFSAERGQEYWSVSIEGEEVQGSLRLPLEFDQNRLLLAEFERLVWPDGDGDGPSESFDPTRFPPLQFYAADLTFLEKPLGEVRFETYPTAFGMHIEGLETSSPILQISASGDWLKSDEEAGVTQPKSRFAGTVTAENLGEVLGAFGFSRMIDSSQLITRLNVDWPGSPSDFSWGSLDGELDLNIGRGQLVEVQPGAGRIFGLLSLQALPRRLLLDFSDLFKSGLTFDSISGHFKLQNGHAQTDNLLLKGPTAQVLIAGRTGLADQDYDQTVTVIPKVGETLPLVGAIAGGGAGAAALFVLQNVFRRQIDKITQYHYSITGSWDEPDIELIGANDTQLN